MCACVTIGSKCNEAKVLIADYLVSVLALLQNRINVPVDFEVVQCMIDMLNALL